MNKQCRYRQMRWTNIGSFCYQKVGKLLTRKVSFYACFMKLFDSKSCGNECVKYSECSRGCICPAQAGRDASHGERLNTKNRIWSPHVSLYSAVSPLTQKNPVPECAVQRSREFPHSRESQCVLPAAAGWAALSETFSARAVRLSTELFQKAAAQSKYLSAVFNLDTEQVPVWRGYKHTGT